MASQSGRETPFQDSSRNPSTKDNSFTKSPRSSTSSPSSRDEKTTAHHPEHDITNDHLDQHGNEDLEKYPTAQDGKPQGPVTRTRTAQDWEGPDDPENPQNWPMVKRVYHSISPALVAFVMTFGTSVYEPATEEIAKTYGVSRVAAILPLSLWNIGLALGPMIGSPLSETFGRKFVYTVSLPLALLFTLGAGSSTNFASLLVLRFLAGTSGSPVLGVGGGTNADLLRIRARLTSIFLMASFLGPALGPLVGGFVVQYKNWRWTQWCILFIGALVWAFNIFTSETYKKIILQRRAKKLNLDPPPSRLPKTPLAFTKYILTSTLLRPLHMLFAEPIVTFMSFYTAFAFSILFGFFAAFPYVFMSPPYNFSLAQTGLVYTGIATGVLIAGVTALGIDLTLYQRAFRAAKTAGKPNAAPEHRLYSAMAGSIGISIGLFWFAWSADYGVHWAVPIVATIPFAWGNFSLFISTALYLVDVYGALNGASALAANGMLRYGMGAAFPLFTQQMYRALGIGWATSLLGFVSFAMIPIPWVLYRWGPRIRARSGYDVNKF